MTRAYRSCWWATSAIWMTSARCPWASANWGRSSGRCPMWRPRLKPAKMWTRWVVVWILPKGSWYFYHPRGGRMSNPTIITDKICEANENSLEIGKLKGFSRTNQNCTRFLFVQLVFLQRLFTVICYFFVSHTNENITEYHLYLTFPQAKHSFYSVFLSSCLSFKW